MNHDIHDPSKQRRECRPLRLLALLACAAVLGGCASFSPDGGFGAVEQTAKGRIGKDLRWARTDADRDTIDKRVAELLDKALLDSIKAGDKVRFKATPDRRPITSPIDLLNPSWRSP